MTDDKDALRQQVARQIEDAFAKIPTLRSGTDLIASTEPAAIDR